MKLESTLLNLTQSRIRWHGAIRYPQREELHVATQKFGEFKEGARTSCRMLFRR